jgi:hypothetical protein
LAKNQGLGAASSGRATTNCDFSLRREVGLAMRNLLGYH